MSTNVLDFEEWVVAVASRCLLLLLLRGLAAELRSAVDVHAGFLSFHLIVVGDVGTHAHIARVAERVNAVTEGKQSVQFAKLGVVVDFGSNGSVLLLLNRCRGWRGLRGGRSGF